MEYRESKAILCEIEMEKTPRKTQRVLTSQQWMSCKRYIGPLVVQILREQEKLRQIRIEHQLPSLELKISSRTVGKRVGNPCLERTEVVAAESIKSGARLNSLVARQLRQHGTELPTRLAFR